MKKDLDKIKEENRELKGYLELLEGFTQKEILYLIEKSLQAFEDKESSNSYCNLDCEIKFSEGKLLITIKKKGEGENGERN